MLTPGSGDSSATSTVSGSSLIVRTRLFFISPKITSVSTSPSGRSSNTAASGAVRPRLISPPGSDSIGGRYERLRAAMIRPVKSHSSAMIGIPSRCRPGLADHRIGTTMISGMKRHVPVPPVTLKYHTEKAISIRRPTTRRTDGLSTHHFHARSHAVCVTTRSIQSRGNDTPTMCSPSARVSGKIHATAFCPSSCSF